MAQALKLDDMDKSDRAKLLQLMEERPASATLTDLSGAFNPTVVWRKWTAATKVKKPKSRSAGVSGTEHGRAKEMIQQQQARIGGAGRGGTPRRSTDVVADRIRRHTPKRPNRLPTQLREVAETHCRDRAKRMEAMGFRRTKRRPKTNYFSQ